MKIDTKYKVSAIFIPRYEKYLLKIFDWSKMSYVNGPVTVPSISPSESDVHFNILLHIWW